MSFINLLIVSYNKKICQLYQQIRLSRIDILLLSDLIEFSFVDCELCEDFIIWDIFSVFEFCEHLFDSYICDESLASIIWFILRFHLFGSIHRNFHEIIDFVCHLLVIDQDRIIGSLSQHISCRSHRHDTISCSDIRSDKRLTISLDTTRHNSTGSGKHIGCERCIGSHIVHTTIHKISHSHQYYHTQSCSRCDHYFFGFWSFDDDSWHYCDIGRCTLYQRCKIYSCKFWIGWCLW